MSELYVYSAGCSWHGPISAVGKLSTPPLRMPNGNIVPDSSLPCCPYCQSVLFQVDNESQWNKGAKDHERKGHTNYVEFLKWTRTQKRCWPSLRDAGQDFTAATGKLVVWDL